MQGSARGRCKCYKPEDSHPAGCHWASHTLDTKLHRHMLTSAPYALGSSPKEDVQPSRARAHARRPPSSECGYVFGDTQRAATAEMSLSKYLPAYHRGYQNTAEHRLR